MDTMHTSRNASMYIIAYYIRWLQFSVHAETRYGEIQYTS